MDTHSKASPRTMRYVTLLAMKLGDRTNFEQQEMTHREASAHIQRMKWALKLRRKIHVKLGSPNCERRDN